ncbi:MAG: type II toxin-antitoxin system HicB family antitoxin [Ignavibacteria bacterium]|jgi:predicted RNase H-like HicB family nuclease|nr:type II toxin-antitoxin system HicB family antitoxin [Ignavibacteria bacterium]
MFNDYIHAAIAQATYEFLADDATFYGEIEGFQGVYATGITIEACRKELMEVLEEWILLSIARHLPLP